jgi:SAM-dependent methyltransferase
MGRSGETGGLKRTEPGGGGADDAGSAVDESGERPGKLARLDPFERVVDATNGILFWLRNVLPWSLPAWPRTAGTWDRLMLRLSPAAQDRAGELRARHDLDAWPRLLTPIQLHEDLALLDLLDRHLPADLPEGRGLEVGAKNGSALPALVAASRRPWDLVELDAHRRYMTMSTRRAHGERLVGAFASGSDGGLVCRFIAGSVTSVKDAYAVITWILPFVHERPLRAWGLPRRFFAPLQLLRHVCSLVAPGGVLFVVNQGEGERDTQRGLFQDLGLQPNELGRLVTPLSPFRRPRFGFLWQRPVTQAL